MVQMDQFAGQKLRHRCREQTCGHQGGKAAEGGGGGVMNWAIAIDMYTLMCIKLMTNENLLNKKKKRYKDILYNTGNTANVLLKKKEIIGHIVRTTCAYINNLVNLFID